MVRHSSAADNRKDQLTMLENEDDMPPEDEATVVPDGFRLQNSRPSALDSYLEERGVLVRLNEHGVVWWSDYSQESGANERSVRLSCAI